MYRMSTYSRGVALTLISLHVVTYQSAQARCLGPLRGSRGRPRARNAPTHDPRSRRNDWRPGWPPGSPAQAPRPPPARGAASGGFAGPLDPFDLFGWSACGLGDLNGDGVEDQAVGSFLDDDGGTNTGCVLVLFMNADGTVDSHQKITSTAGCFTGVLDSPDYFGT